MLQRPLLWAAPTVVSNPGMEDGAMLEYFLTVDVRKVCCMTCCMAAYKAARGCNSCKSRSGGLMVTKLSDQGQFAVCLLSSSSA